MLHFFYNQRFLIVLFVDSNLLKQEKLEELKRGIDVRIAEVTKLAFENEQLHMKYQNFADKYSPKNILVGGIQSNKSINNW